MQSLLVTIIFFHILINCHAAHAVIFESYSRSSTIFRTELCTSVRRVIGRRDTDSLLVPVLPCSPHAGQKYAAWFDGTTNQVAWSHRVTHAPSSR
ncbi:uncharacterized protein PHACADRAFT_93151 [Phanerochaete carnosa HHB-10118-sp]|uniref:Secreted protein n=1 Tax=Phanerochaete carnosa (strain HHB-10118-sp) TaxID=650164 RepID=K5WBR1_PHACS|nr:uncharacterized protein PHACADRAFT_93151 [Phanerochaete carnosa HHB-10118-sp]EKM56409.1 hypothetical protein PHACADRAFT_93151 [Phanerochaete carnosa HHB-10118-sp]